jgi:hypothetical protein
MFKENTYQGIVNLESVRLEARSKRFKNKERGDKK